ncbi:PRP1 splicing factor, N-terminal-domain-containing protein [Limtongia smithiae]|uniref:PRP1 splicing factor, N-terminal-domain-containing protein n=1 Tax=Limtongia smithiae TaxID=1125753 RepID=UPI0034CE4E07
MFAPRRDFLNEEAPANYVAGLGRGATGFTTRSDIGPAREGPSDDAIQEALAKRAEQIANENAGNDDEDRFADAENDAGIFAKGAYDEEDEEADKIYSEVDERMDSRRKARREAREKQEQEEYELKNPKVSQQFADLKRALSKVSDDEWANIPEVGDLTGKNRRGRKALQSERRFYAVPDSVLAGRAPGSYDNSVDSSADGAASSLDGTITDFRQISQAKDKMLGIRLDQAGTDSEIGSTNIDPKGYLTSLSNSVVRTGTDSEVGSVSKHRELLLSVVKTDPKHANGWIAIAKLEEQANRLSAARKYIQQGCDNCPTNEDVWLENMRLNSNPSDAKIIAARAAQHMPKSVKIWLEAMNLETETVAKKRVVRKALENIPQSVTLWKEAVNLEEDPNDAKILLARATTLVPLAVDLWVALARLETDDNARKVLNKARQAVRTSHEFWVEGAKLEERAGNAARVDMLISRGVAELQRRGGMLKREQWIEEAESCEREGMPATCQAIIRATLGQGIEDDDREAVWLEDAQRLIGKECYETARAVYAYALRVFPNVNTLWQRATSLEKLHGTTQSLFAILEKAVEACPDSKDLWLLYSKECVLSSDVDAARSVLSRAFEHNPNDEDIWIAAVDIEASNKEYDRARQLLLRARNDASTERVWIKSVVLERQLKDPAAALLLVNEALQMFPKSPKLSMMKGQIFESLQKPDQAREAYSSGTKASPKSVTLWLLLARLEESIIVRCRSVLERAALANPKSPRLWLERIRVERRHGNVNQAKNLVAKALQECPTASYVWAESVAMEPRTQRKPRLIDALKKCENDAVIICAIARLFWGERKPDKAKSWFEKAVKADPDNGDNWAWWYKMLAQYNDEAEITPLVDKFVVTDPRHGEVWPVIVKDVDNFGKDKVELLKLAASKMTL